VKTHRRVVAALSADAVKATREVYRSVPNDALRVAALVEISAAAASLARTIVKLRHLDPALVGPHVKDVTDLYAVLGRGRWLPTMTRHVAIPAKDRLALAELALRTPDVPPHRHRPAPRVPGQMPLFESAVGEG
jgi:hypothetical protein